MTGLPQNPKGQYVTQMRGRLTLKPEEGWFSFVTQEPLVHVTEKTASTLRVLLRPYQHSDLDFIKG